MTHNLIGQGDKAILHGVEYHTKEVKSVKTIKENGKPMLVFELQTKDGKPMGILKCPPQNANNKAYIDITHGPDNISTLDYVEINRFWGAEFTGTQNNDRVKLNGCTSSTVDVSGDEGSKDRVTITDDKKFKSIDNTVIMDDGDKINVKGNKVTGEGIFNEK